MFMIADSDANAVQHANTATSASYTSVNVVTFQVYFRRGIR